MKISNLSHWDWDEWQIQVLKRQGNLTIRAGRQAGKSEVISQKAVDFALEHPGTVTLIIAASQRQSGLLFEKVRGRLDMLDEYADKPTLTRVILKNGSRIYSLPAGRTAYSIRGYTIDLLIADECAYIPENVWLAVTPMLAVSKQTRGFGWQILISTPFGKGGYYYDSFTDPDFMNVHVSSEDCPRLSKAFLKKEKARMTKEQYRQEYLAEFTDDWHQFFSTTLIKERMTFIEWNKTADSCEASRFYLGVDFAGYGGDENAFVIVELVKNKVKVVKCITTERESAPSTIGYIQKMNELYKFKRIFVDDGGLGSPITDLLKEKLGSRHVIGLNNSRKRLQEQGEDLKKGIFKEDLYSNTLMLMETGHIDIISDLDLLRSMKSITYEYTADKKIKIFGAYSHLTEALVRACWCIKERGLDLYLF